MTNYVETTFLRDMGSKAEAAYIISMLAPEKAAELDPGALLRTEGESNERYAKRSKLMEKLFAVPDAE